MFQEVQESPKCFNDRFALVLVMSSAELIDPARLFPSEDCKGCGSSSHSLCPENMFVDMAQ